MMTARQTLTRMSGPCGKSINFKMLDMLWCYAGGTRGSHRLSAMRGYRSNRTGQAFSRVQMLHFDGLREGEADDGSVLLNNGMQVCDRRDGNHQEKEQDLDQ